MAHLRLADRQDIPALSQLIDRSARALCINDYDPEVVAGALKGHFGVDTTLIDDGTYVVIEEEGALVACGGWSRRATMFGGDAYAKRDPVLLVPPHDPARIRAFFVAPEFARRGFGRQILEYCEGAAQAEGFVKCTLMATLTGIPFYEKCGFVALGAEFFPLADGGEIEFRPMIKELSLSS
ncbi:GNAT family N-acetyltransferase [Parvularcula sp. LCG005]|uniref:GNAT family N-acetyltransferase n=1 Tax=Parvularcula sp. LCG005 TaxID=3078805 RepID=UPI002942CF7C|nr:GNAT family N-acetyltransferase [Parvularcula sp. LCG005]WOI54432.1 GNAT family N-acetyltransferase [Parvularcula sp. LCG005]